MKEENILITNKENEEIEKQIEEEGEDDNHAIIAIIPCNAIDEAKDNLSDSLLGRTVYLFEAKGDGKITVYLKMEE